ncbi:alpha/beta fold hydrolase [Peterkaempfera bronchialis]|uniref:Alpha/beta hydrolase n=1 Tax=Peterkaempfera bronchialis TaxID=2126346 RepID=A0A345T1Z7_9ACTN|nr:alpha/beta hydrolase [Peterkaempfera bronchialis]AXI80002.1 alpha/beta hydrolase [Peterkaempfera bronchialis]
MGVPLPDTFRYRRIEADGVRINCAVGGDGPPVLLLHGYPQTHLTWHLVAPRLAADHTVVLTDLRGYGDSDKPAPGPAAEPYAKRAMARDQLLVMRALGHERFALVGHDRGARVGHRLALDAPEAVGALALLDIVPTRYAFGHVDRALATAYFHWFFLALGNGVPERLIGADPEFWLRALMSAQHRPGAESDPAAMREYVRCFSTPEAVAASCADYRAAATIDLEHDAASAAQSVQCPTLVLWGAHGFVGRTYDVPAVWRGYASDLRGQAVAAGHFLPEEAPRETADALLGFLRESRRESRG